MRTALSVASSMALPLALPLSLLGLSACKDAGLDSAPVEAPAFTPLTEAAPWAVGTDEISVEGPGGLTLPTQLWFPASSVGDEPYEYDDLVASGVLDDGAPDCASPRPVVLFSHGNSGVRYQSWFLTEPLAARGFLVAAPDHVGNTVFDMDDVSYAVLNERRPMDIAATWDALVAASADPSDALYGCVDPAAGFAVVGHSYGGYTALAVAGAEPQVDATAAQCEATGGWQCEAMAEWSVANPGEAGISSAHPDVWAVVAHSPAAYELLVGGLDEIAVPAAVLSGHDDDLTPWPSVSAIYAGLSVEPRALGGVYEAGHFSFSNSCDMVSTFEDCDPPYLPPEEVHEIALGWTYAWLVAAWGQPEAMGWIATEDERVSWESEG